MTRGGGYLSCRLLDGLADRLQRFSPCCLAQGIERSGGIVKRLEVVQRSLLVEAIREDRPEDRGPALPSGFQEEGQLHLHDEARSQGVRADQEDTHPRRGHGRLDFLPPGPAGLDLLVGPGMDGVEWRQHGEELQEPALIRMAVAHEDRGPARPFLGARGHVAAL